MASPTVRGTPAEGSGASATAHTITFAQNTGDRVVIFLANDATARTWSLGDSFVNLTNTSATFHIFTKVLDGSEGGNMVATAGVATKSAWIAYNITAGTHAGATTPVFSTVATGTSTAPNASSLTPAGGSADYLWLTAFGQAGEEADDDTWVSGTPTSFSGTLQKTSGTTGAVTVNCSVASAQYAFTGSVLDAAAWTVAQSLAWRAYTVAIYPNLNVTSIPSAASLATSMGTPTVTATNNVTAVPWAPDHAQVLLVVGDAASPSTADTALKSHIEGLGHTVTLISDETAEPSPITAYGLVIIFESVSGATIGSKYNTAAVPILAGEHTVWGSDYMTSAGGLTDTGIVQMYMDLAGDPIAGGVPQGDFDVISVAGSASLSYADASTSSLGTGAVVVARRQSDHAYATLWRYETGTQWHPSFGNAVARRVAFDVSDEALGEGHFNSNTWALYDASIRWLLGSLILTGAVPTVTVSASSNVTAVPSPASLTTSMGTPAVLAPRVSVPTAAALVTSLATPAVGVTALAVPTAASLTLTGATPTIPAVEQEYEPTAAALALTMGTPLVRAPRVSVPTAASLALSLATPAVLAPRVSVPTAASLTATGATPTVTTPVLSLPTVASLTTSMGTPIVTAAAAGVSVPTPASLTLSMGTPVVTAAQRYEPTAASLTTSMGTPIVTAVGGAVSVPTAASLALTMGTPVVTAVGTAWAQPTPATLALAFGTPTVVATDAKRPQPTPAALALTFGTPIVDVAAQLLAGGYGPVASSTQWIPAGTAASYAASVTVALGVPAATGHSAITSAVPSGEATNAKPKG